MVEVLVAGGGPAGAAAALVLARAGARVLLVDRARFPRPKLCGDTLNPGALALLATLGLRDDVEAQGLVLEGMRVTSARGVVVTARYPGCHGLAMTREALDALLLGAAARAGAQIEEGVRVVGPLLDECDGRPVVRGARLQTPRGPLRVPAAWTVAAEGRRSPLALALGLSSHPRAPRRWAVGAYFSGVSELGAHGEMHIRSGHYIGVAPLPGGLANACVVTADRHRLAHPLRLLDEVLAGDPLLADRFAGASRVSPIVCVGPLAVDARASGVDGLLLAGDAAGFVDPMTGDGLRFAIGGGMLAARALLPPPARARGWTPVRWLSAARRREFAWKLRLNRLLRALVASERAVRLAEGPARLSPALLRALIRLAGDVPPRPRADTRFGR